MPRINLGIIGAGNIAEEHLKVIKNIANFEVVAITSRTLHKAKKLSKVYKIKEVFSDYKSMINRANIDALLILVSAESIYTVTKKIIPYKIPFFVEKPPGITFKESNILNNLLKKYKVNNMVGFNRRYYSNFHEGMKIINKNGKLLSVVIEGHERFWKLSKKINNKNKKNWIYSNNSHMIDLIRFFGGEISSINSFSQRYVNKTADQFVAAIQFKNGCIGSYIANWFSPSGWSVKLFGNGVLVEFKPLEKGIWIDKKFKKHKIKMHINDIKYKPGFYNQMVAFKKMLINGTLQWPGQNISQIFQTTLIIRKISGVK